MMASPRNVSMPSAPTRQYKKKPRLNPWLFLRRAMRLRCPECGHARIFKPWRATRSLDDWFRPLDGCPNCDYTYEPEEGYFLIATWVFNYAAVVSFAFAMAFLIEWLFAPPLLLEIAAVVIPMRRIRWKRPDIGAVLRWRGRKICRWRRIWPSRRTKASFWRGIRGA